MKLQNKYLFQNTSAMAVSTDSVYCSEGIVHLCPDEGVKKNYPEDGLTE